ncbi:806_t:CDS:2, partial [Cetraspora pellucida]
MEMNIVEREEKILLHNLNTRFKGFWLKRQDFTDSFKKLHPTERTYTWSNQEAATRIDYIWLSETIAASFQEANIEEAEGITSSDHKIVTT